MGDIKITIKKAFIQLGLGAISIIAAGIASVYGNNATYLALAPLIDGFLAGLINWLKHRNDE